MDATFYSNETKKPSCLQEGIIGGGGGISADLHRLILTSRSDQSDFKFIFFYI